MTDKQKTTQEEPRMPFTEMMQKMMGWQWPGCDCAKMMSQMIAMCGAAQDETEEEVAPEENQKA